MIYELRIYHIYPDKMDAIHNRFRNHTLQLFEKHHMKTIDFWEDISTSNKIYYVLEHFDIETRDENFKAFQNDPEWLKVKNLSELQGPIVERIESYFMKRVPYSPASVS